MQLPNSFVALQLWDGGGPLELHAPTRSNYQVKRESTYNRGPPHRFLNTRFYYPGPQTPPPSSLIHHLLANHTSDLTA